MEKIIKYELSADSLPPSLVRDIDQKRSHEYILLKVPKFDIHACIFKYWKLCLGAAENCSILKVRVMLINNFMESALVHFGIVRADQSLQAKIITKLNEWKQTEIYERWAEYYLRRFEEENIAYKFASLALDK